MTKTFQENGIPTYTEIIIGLPGETLQSFKNGLETIAQTKVGTLLWGYCSVLPNAPMNIPEYKQRFKIKTRRSPVHLRHVSMDYVKKDKNKEFEEIVYETSSYTFEELKEMMLYAWAFSTFQNLSIFEHISEYYNQIHNLSFISFYETFFEFSKSQNSIFSKEIEIVTKYLDDGLSGRGWDHIEPKFGDINWPIEEASWLRLVPNIKIYERETMKFLEFLENKFTFKSGKEILEDLIKFQGFLLTSRNYLDESKTEKFEIDWKDFFINNRKSIKKTSKQYYCKNPITEKNSILWNCQVVFWGRRARKFKINLEKIYEDDSIIESNQAKQENKPPHSSNWDL